MEGNMIVERRTLFASAVGAWVAGWLPARASGAPGAAPAMSADELRLHTDWAYLARFKAENDAVRAGPPEQRRVVFLGDSITQGWIDKHPRFFADNGFVDRGISGQTTPQMLVRFRQDVISLAPRAVHIMAGTNDVAGNTGPFDPDAVRDNFCAMAELARANRLKVILAATPPAGDFPWRKGLEPAPKIQALNAWLRDFAQREKFVFADYSAVLDDGNGAMKPGLAYDGVHPSQAGYDAMEPVTLAAVSTALL
jgi:lysophospholipase L1-like esterase